MSGARRQCMSATGTRRLAVSLASCFAMIALPAAADWVVTVDGARLETDGAWVEQGRMLVFHTASGALMSLRLADVDLDASHNLTREMAAKGSRPTAAPTPSFRPSVLRLTDEDVAHVDDEEYFGADPESNGEEPPEAAPFLAVVAWDRFENAAGDGLEVRATLENQGQDVAVSIIVNVTAFDIDGELLASAPAQLAASGLAPGQRTKLVAQFPDLIDFAALKFDIQQRALATRPSEQAPLLDDDSDSGQDFDPDQDSDSGD